MITSDSRAKLSFPSIFKLRFLQAGKYNFWPLLNAITRAIKPGLAEFFGLAATYAGTGFLQPPSVENYRSHEG